MKLKRITHGRKVERISLSTCASLIPVLAGVVFGFLSFVIPVRAQLAHIYFVRNTGDIVVAGACGNGTGIGTIHCSLRGAIEAVNAGGSGVIFFSIPSSDPNCTAGVCTINLTSALPNLSSSNTSINGPGADKLTVRRGTGEFRIFLVTADGTVNISGLFITGGSANAGAGIYHTGLGTLNVTNCRLSNNSAFSSFAVGGGIANSCCGTLNVINSTISNNAVGSGSNAGGGGIYNEGGTVNLTNSTLRDNICSSGSPTKGGGIRNNAGTVNVTNSTISSNRCFGSPGDGGGIYTSGGSVIVKNSIIALNTATTAGPDLNGSFVSAGFNLIGKRDGSTGFTNSTDQTGTIAAPLDPMLDPAGLQNNGGPTLTVALLPGSPAIDKATSNPLGPGGLLTTDQRSYRRIFDNTAISNPSDGTDIGAFELQSKSPADFDGDNKTDVGIFRPPVGEWWYLRSSDGQVPAFQFGASTDKIVPADFSGDGKTDVAIYRPVTGEWFILRSENFSYYSFPFGAAGDIPMPANYDNDGKADPAVFRPSNGLWVINRSSDQGNTILPWGQNGDVPVSADYDGDGRADIAIWRPSAGEWWLLRSTAGAIGFGFGSSTDKPVQGDYTGDGKADVAFWRPATGEWFVLRSENQSYYSVPFGISPDVPAPGDYDGDGKFDTTVFRPSNGFWHIQRTTAGVLSLPFGANGDRPIPSVFIP